MPVRSDRSATRAERLDERTAEKVAAASTRVPPAVANDEMVCQSATAPGYWARPAPTASDQVNGLLWGRAGGVARKGRT